MLARVSVLEGDVEHTVKQVEERTAAQVRKMDGNQGFVVVVDRTADRALAVSLWENDDARKASQEAANRLRDDAAGQGRVVSADDYEVIFCEVPGTG